MTTAQARTETSHKNPAQINIGDSIFHFVSMSYSIVQSVTPVIGTNGQELFKIKTNQGLSLLRADDNEWVKN